MKTENEICDYCKNKRENHHPNTYGELVWCYKYAGTEEFKPKTTKTENLCENCGTFEECYNNKCTCRCHSQPKNQNPKEFLSGIHHSQDEQARSRKADSASLSEVTASALKSKSNKRDGSSADNTQTLSDFENGYQGVDKNDKSSLKIKEVFAKMQYQFYKGLECGRVEKEEVTQKILERKFKILYRDRYLWVVDVEDIKSEMGEGLTEK